MTREFSGDSSIDSILKMTNAFTMKLKQQCEENSL